MINSIYNGLLNMIMAEKENFDVLVSADNVLGLNVTSEDIINYLEFSNGNNSLNSPIIGNVIITEGDILSVLKVINDLKNNTGEYVLYINDDNLGTISYLVGRANRIYKNLGINIIIKIDYSKNYNEYLDTLVTVVGSKEFNKETEFDFSNANHIIV